MGGSVVKAPRSRVEAGRVDPRLVGSRMHGLLCSFHARKEAAPLPKMRCLRVRKLFDGTTPSHLTARRKGSEAGTRRFATGGGEQRGGGQDRARH